MMKGHATNVWLDDVAWKSANMKRPFSTSALVRFWLKVLVKSEDELVRLKKTDEEFKAILLYCRERIEKVFGE